MDASDPPLIIVKMAVFGTDSLGIGLVFGGLGAQCREVSIEENRCVDVRWVDVISRRLDHHGDGVDATLRPAELIQVAFRETSASTFVDRISRFVDRIVVKRGGDDRIEIGSRFFTVELLYMLNDPSHVFCRVVAAMPLAISGQQAVEAGGVGAHPALPGNRKFDGGRAHRAILAA